MAKAPENLLGKPKPVGRRVDQMTRRAAEFRKDPAKYAAAFIKRMKERREGRTTDAGTVAVDAARVEFAFGRSLKAVGKFWENICEITCFTAKIAYDEDNGIGAFRTPGNCDGKYKVKVIDGIGFMALPAIAPNSVVGEILVPDDAQQMVLGDCGKVHVTIKFKDFEHRPTLIRFWWADDNTLWVSL
jgi:hypothetical protein